MLSDIMTINRFREPPPSGPMCDLIWSDPMDEEEEEVPGIGLVVCTSTSHVFAKVVPLLPLSDKPNSSLACVPT